MKRRSFLQILSFAGAAVALPTQLAALVEGPPDEELPLKMSLCGREIRSVEVYIPEIRNITCIGDELESVIPIGPPRIHLELDWTPPEGFEPGVPVDLEIDWDNLFIWKTKALVIGYVVNMDGTLSMDLVQVRREDGQV